MAYTSSGQLPLGSSYKLGGYSLSLDTRTIPQTDLRDVTARCTGPDGKSGIGNKQIASNLAIEGWSVEANADSVSVYVSAKAPPGPSIPEPFYSPVPASLGRAVGYYNVGSNRVLVGLGSNPKGTATWTRNLSDGWFTLLLAQSDNPTPFADFLVADAHYSYVNHGSSYTFAGKTVYFCSSLNNNYSGVAPPVGYDLDRSGFGNAAGPIAWQMIYGAGAGKTEDVLVARFAIDLGEAGGYPGGGWTQPGDWNPDPTTTLHLTVNGALSGRHNDPLNDPSYSYVPADNTAQAGYGCGGDGGHGGGGGGGASTIITRQFATNKANSKEILALAKRHGYGCGGGKGGKGGDGCILIYY